MAKVIKKIIYNDEEQYAEKYGGTMFGDPVNKPNSQTALIQAEMANNGVLEVRKVIAQKADIGDLNALTIVVGGKAGLNDIGQRNLIRNSKTMIFPDYGYEVDGGLTDENDSTLTDEESTVLTDGTPARKKITEVPEATGVTSEDLLFINQGDAIKQISLSDVLTEGDKHFTYTQSLPSATWVIQHNLGKCPDVTVVDSAGTEVIGDCEYNDINTVTITFSGSFGGVAYLN